ncbi:MAG: G5 domain-containing protein [Candidatus Berkelbacteria bacterium]|nr:G5 domain-containing protein [Candidatus Berkelbacteria bacterium]
MDNPLFIFRLTYITLFSLLIVFAVVFWPQQHRRAQVLGAYDENYLVGRAISLAGFGAEDRAVEPEINYLFPGEKIELDILDPSLRVVNIFDLNLGVGAIQVIFHAPEYKVTDAGRATYVRSFKAKVGGVIADGGIVLAKEDMVKPSLDSLAQRDIEITRVSIAEIEEFETISYQTKEIEDSNLERGLKRVEKAGRTGKKKHVFKVRRENGLEVARDLIRSEVVEKPEDRVIRIGTKVVVLSSVRGYATATNLSNAVVSANYRRGTLIRITNLANGVSIFKTVNYTWGIASPPDGVVLDLSWNILDELKFSGQGKGPMVLVEEIKQ